MAAEDRERAFEAFVAARAPALLRTAYLVTGDAASAERLLREALATTYLTWRHIDEREGTEVYARRVMLTAHAAQPTTTPPQPSPDRPEPSELHERIWSSLRALTPRQRAVLVLGVRDRLDDEELARVLTCSRKAVQADAAHALNAVRATVTARPVAPEPSPSEGADRSQAPLSVASLDTAIRETLTARADDVRPPRSLVDDARERADVLSRRARGQRRTVMVVVLGLVVVVGVVAALISLRGSGVAAAPASPSPSSGSSSPRPGASVVAVPDMVLKLARDNDALVAYGSAIVDASAGPTMVTVEPDPATGASRGDEILALARAAFGYVVLTRSEGIGPVQTPRVLSFVRPDGSRVELGRTTVDGSGFAVSADGLSVVHVIQGPVDGENAVPVGGSQLVVQDLASDVMNRITVVGLVSPISVTGDEVVFRRVDDSTSPAFVWHRATGLVEPLALRAGEVAVQAHDRRVLVRGGARRECVSVDDAFDLSHPDRLWQQCGVFGTTSFDPASSKVAMVTSPEATSALLVLDTKSGARTFSSRLLPGFPFQLEWTANGQKVLVSSVGAQGLVTYTAVGAPGRGVIASATYQVPQGPVVLGQELPLPATDLGTDQPVVTP